MPFEHQPQKQSVKNTTKELQVIVSTEHSTVLLQYNSQIQGLHQNTKKSLLIKLEYLKCKKKK